MIRLNLHAFFRIQCENVRCNQPVLHSSVSESLGKWVALYLQSGYLLVLISCHSCKLSLLEHKRFYGPVVDGGGLVLTLSYHDVDSRLISVHRVEYNLWMKSRLIWMLL